MRFIFLSPPQFCVPSALLPNLSMIAGEHNPRRSCPVPAIPFVHSDTQVDMWSVGLIFAEILTKQPLLQVGAKHSRIPSRMYPPPARVGRRSGRLSMRVCVASCDGRVMIT